jgi:hypothetical protein
VAFSPVRSFQLPFCHSLFYSEESPFIASFRVPMKRKRDESSDGQFLSFDSYRHALSDLEKFNSLLFAFPKIRKIKAVATKAFWFSKDSFINTAISTVIREELFGHDHSELLSDKHKKTLSHSIRAVLTRLYGTAFLVPQLSWEKYERIQDFILTGKKDYSCNKSYGNLLALLSVVCQYTGAVSHRSASSVEWIQNPFPRRTRIQDLFHFDIDYALRCMQEGKASRARIVLTRADSDIDWNGTGDPVLFNSIKKSELLAVSPSASSFSITNNPFPVANSLRNTNGEFVKADENHTVPFCSSPDEQSIALFLERFISVKALVPIVLGYTGRWFESNARSALETGDFVLSFDLSLCWL